MGLTGMSKVMFPIENEDQNLLSTNPCSRFLYSLGPRCMDVGRTTSYGTHRYAYLVYGVIWCMDVGRTTSYGTHRYA